MPDNQQFKFIANCKYCGMQPIICNRTAKHTCSVYGEYCFHCNTWNSLNTDQYGQQLTNQNITWITWDGDIEHLPENETEILVKREGFMDIGKIDKPKNINDLVCIWYDYGDYDYFFLKKDDQFAIMEK